MTGGAGVAPGNEATTCGACVAPGEFGHFGERVFLEIAKFGLDSLKIDH